jgi:hypothetical protein
MPDNTIPPPPLTTAMRRAEVAGMIARHTMWPVSAVFVVELLDALSGALLRTAGLSDQAAKAALDTMWRRP